MNHCIRKPMGDVTMTPSLYTVNGSHIMLGKLVLFNLDLILTFLIVVMVTFEETEIGRIYLFFLKKILFK